MARAVVCPRVFRPDGVKAGRFRSPESACKGILAMVRYGAGLLVSLLATTSAWGQEVCPPRHEIEDYLAAEFQERPVASGIANNGGVIEVFSSDELGTWTIIITMPTGQSCMIAAGQDWENQPVIVPTSDAELTVSEPEA